MRFTRWWPAVWYPKEKINFSGVDRALINQFLSSWYQKTYFNNKKLFKYENMTITAWQVSLGLLLHFEERFQCCFLHEFLPARSCKFSTSKANEGYLHILIIEPHCLAFCLKNNSIWHIVSLHLNIKCLTKLKLQL